MSQSSKMLSHRIISVKNVDLIYATHEKKEVHCFHLLAYGLISQLVQLNSWPNNISNWFKAFADDKIDGIEKLKFILGKVKNIVGKGEDAGFQHFLLFPQYFQKASFSGSLKVRIVW